MLEEATLGLHSGEGPERLGFCWRERGFGLSIRQGVLSKGVWMGTALCSLARVWGAGRGLICTEKWESSRLQGGFNPEAKPRLEGVGRSGAERLVLPEACPWGLDPTRCS